MLQRCASHLASLTDINEAFAQGQKGVELAEAGETATMVCLKRVSNFPYKVEISHAPINNIANEAKSVPREWINEDGNDITQDLLDYLYPLIQGEVTIEYERGIPSYMNVSHLRGKKSI